jgi:hypothetical protein
MDYYAFAVAAIGFGLCSLIVILKYRALVKEINTHSQKKAKK